MKLKLIAAAAALAAAGSAGAAVTLPSTGNSDMVANFFSTASNSTISFDLGISMLDFTNAVGGSATGIKLVWDLDAGTFQDLSAAATGLVSQAINYGNLFNEFLAEGSLNSLKFDVKAGDRNPTFNPAAGTNNLLTTSAAPSVTSQNAALFNALNVLGTSFGFMNGDATGSTHGAATAGANKYNDGDIAAQYAFLTRDGENLKNLPFQTTGSVSNPLNMFLLANSSSAAAGAAVVTALSGLWTFDALTNQLIYATAPVPEPEAFAMLLAGLGLMGAIARRRRSQA